MSAAITTPRRAWGASGREASSAHLVPGWLRLLWGEHRLGMSSACPACLASGASRASLPKRVLPLGLSVYPDSKGYRFHCASCAWRSPWFEVLSDGRLVAVMLDVP
jgi:hypothetical protein